MLEIVPKFKKRMSLHKIKNNKKDGERAHTGELVLPTFNIKTDHFKES